MRKIGHYYLIPSNNKWSNPQINSVKPCIKTILPLLNFT
jgi:hypothetical protein